MRLRTKDVTPQEVAEDWKRQYCQADGTWNPIVSNAQAVYEALFALPVDASLEEIEKIVGNDTWTSYFCDECGGSSHSVVVVGSLSLCQRCVVRALDLLRLRGLLLEDALVEDLADYAHRAWSGWMEYFFSKCYVYDDGLIIPTDFVLRWKRQVRTSYDDLPMEERQSDRTEAHQMLDIFARHGCMDRGERGDG